MATEDRRVSGPTLAKTCCATLWLWPGRAIYCGPSLALDTHSGSVACLAVGLDDVFTVHCDGRQLTARTALIPARTPHRLVAHGERMVFAYLDPGSPLERACRGSMRLHAPKIAHDHVNQAELLRFDAPEEWLALAAPAPREPLDPRIAAVTEALLRDDGGGSAVEFAARVGLSTSRFQHLFTAQTSTSFRRYRLWARMLRVGSALAAGRDLTVAALDAGFASSSHFSNAFHAMFGLTPTRLATTVRIVVRTR
jgi:AraC-like DNA-binding protein